jgi:hypothetical protein
VGRLVDNVVADVVVGVEGAVDIVVLRVVPPAVEVLEDTVDAVV